MKKTRLHLWIVSVTTILTLASCDAGKLNKKAEETATSFYTALQKKEYSKALSLCSDAAFKEQSKDIWTTSLETNATDLGEVKSFTKASGFNVSASTSSATSVTMAYDVEWQYGKSTDTLILEKQDDGSMKISVYKWKHRDAAYSKNLNISEKETAEYMDALEKGSYEEALALCSSDPAVGAPKDKWIAFLQNANNQLGSVAAYRILKDSSTVNLHQKGDAGMGNYYQVLVESERGSNKVKEKLVFFQKDYDEPVKISGHFFM